MSNDELKALEAAVADGNTGRVAYVMPFCNMHYTVSAVEGTSIHLSDGDTVDATKAHLSYFYILTPVASLVK